MRLSSAATQAIDAARAEGRVTDGPRTRLPEAPMTEKEFQQRVVLYAKACGWLVYHTLNSRGSESGFPDLVLARPWGNGGARPARVLYAELKTARGRLSPAQSAWLDVLRNADQHVYVWTPADMPEIERTLAEVRGWVEGE